MLATKQIKSKRPSWLKVKLSGYSGFNYTLNALEKLNLATVCQQSCCPNLGRCFSGRQATFLLLGQVCTRNCSFCQIRKGKPEKIDPKEPEKLVQAVKKLSLKKVVLTSVTRDDLPDGGAQHLANCVRKLKQELKELFVEVLISDFKEKSTALETIFQSQPDVIGHNLETVARLYPLVRPKADYFYSLNVLKQITAAGFSAKTGLMLGLGETYQEVISCLNDAYKTGVAQICLGQYLPPTSQHAPVKRYYSPGFFQHLALLAKQIGFKQVKSGPLVRSSY